MDCNNDYIYSDAEALFSVGKRFLEGDCLEKDPVKARDLLSRAASLGHRKAQELLLSMEETPSEDSPEARVWDDMVSGREYDATHPYLLERLNATKDRIWEYNKMRPSMLKERNELLRGLLGKSDGDTFINQPFYCDYGSNIRVGRRFFANFNFTVLDEAPVTVGDNCFIGPNVSIYTACHSTDPVERNSRREWAKPVTIGDNVWIGGSVTILPGVTIGSNVTIGAGSVVVKDIPDGCVAVGNPCRVVKRNIR
ncbi:MAG: DapH/DapD/GlmU-related protein [Candidatus Cryptobacteroides sp.]|nr:DapH/DapD/GlmU-related protein [Candidatus Cryptobacteroides sp.]